MTDAVWSLLGGGFIAVIGLVGTYLTARYRRDAGREETSVAVLQEQLRKRDRQIVKVKRQLVACIEANGDVDDVIRMIRAGDELTLQDLDSDE